MTAYTSRRGSRRPNPDLVEYRGEVKYVGQGWPSSWVRAYEKFPGDPGTAPDHALRVLRRYVAVFGDEAEASFVANRRVVDELRAGRS